MGGAQVCVLESCPQHGNNGVCLSMNRSKQTRDLSRMSLLILLETTLWHPRGCHCSRPFLCDLPASAARILYTRQDQAPGPNLAGQKAQSTCKGECMVGSKRQPRSKAYPLSLTLLPHFSIILYLATPLRCDMLSHTHVSGSIISVPFTHLISSIPRARFYSLLNPERRRRRCF